jgi:hypothetical protein
MPRPDHLTEEDFQQMAEFSAHELRLAKYYTIGSAAMAGTFGTLCAFSLVGEGNPLITAISGGFAVGSAFVSKNSINEAIDSATDVRHYQALAAEASQKS